jgi:hypothetical protein
MEQIRDEDGTAPKADGAAADVKDTLKAAGSTLKNQARDAADEAKNKSVEQVTQVTRAVHGAADQIAEQIPLAGEYIHAAADRLDSAASSLRERSVEDLASSFANFARRQPAAAFAGSVLAGFALSRFLKSSAPYGSTPIRGRPS